MKYALVNGRKTHIRDVERGTLGYDCWFRTYEVKACKGHYMQYWKYTEDKPVLPIGYENETEWHAAWKAAIKDDFCEVICGDNQEHRADIKTPKQVIELQYSGIPFEEVQRRNKFYTELTGSRIIWVVNTYKAWKNKRIVTTLSKDGRKGELLVQWSYPKRWVVDICESKSTTVLLDISPTANNLLQLWKHKNQLYGKWTKKEDFFCRYLKDIATCKADFLEAIKNVDVRPFL